MFKIVRLFNRITSPYVGSFCIWYATHNHASSHESLCLAFAYFAMMVSIGEAHCPMFTDTKEDKS